MKLRKVFKRKTISELYSSLNIDVEEIRTRVSINES
jgi:hypothetical protein